MDIVESETLFVFIHFARRDFSCNDFAEKAVGIVVHRVKTAMAVV